MTGTVRRRGGVGLGLAVLLAFRGWAAVCLCGEAPERANDFFWENDRVGFRAYGPGDVHKWSGIDVFNKGAATNLVVHWLREPGRHGNWHLNRGGFGMDDYAVGPGRGVGGIAFRRNGKWLADYGNWVRYRVLTNGDERCAFELDYNLPFGGTMTLAVSLARGSSLFREAVRFSSDTPLDGLEVGAGLDLNAVRVHVGDLEVDAAAGRISLYEKPHGRPGEEGELMSAILAAPGQALTVADEPNGAKMLMTKPLKAGDAGREVLVVYAGADWSCAGRFTAAEAWHAYVKGGVALTASVRQQGGWSVTASVRQQGGEGVTASVRQQGPATCRYLDLVETAVRAYSDAHLGRYLADVEREGVQEHGFPRLAANLALLVSHGRCPEKREILARMLDCCCRDAQKEMPPKSGGNEFSVKELVVAVSELEKAKTFPKPVTDGWRGAISSIVAEKSYTTGRLPVGADRAYNWVVFAAASEQSRLAHGMGGDPRFVERYVADQLRWFDANGMYRDPNCPAVYDFVTRLQFAQILHDGYDGPSRAKLEEMMEKSAEPTLAMLSACGEIPYGGRSNQFLHNNTFYAALCEWYASCCRGLVADTTGKQQAYDNKSRTARFRAAVLEALEALKPWLEERPPTHVKNRYPREEGKGVFSERGDMGCERYAYFDKYMITMGSWAALGWLFAEKQQAYDSKVRQQAYDSKVRQQAYDSKVRQQAYDGKVRQQAYDGEVRQQAYDGETCCRTAGPSVFVTTPDFHFVFLRAGDYSAQFDYNSDSHYDCDGLGRIHRRGAPTALCLSTPCAKSPNYRIEPPNDAPLAIAPVLPASASPCRFVRARTNATEAVCEWRTGDNAWLCRLTPEGMEMSLTGTGAVALTLPALAFDGRGQTEIAATAKTLAVSYRGWRCLYETDGEIVDTGRSSSNRNGRYERYEARGRKTLKVRVTIAGGGRP